MAEYPLGICLARNMLDRDDKRAMDLHNAGLRYAKIRSLVLGRVNRGSRTFDAVVDVGRVFSDDPTADQLKREREMSDLFGELREQLVRAGTRAMHAIDNIVIHERLPKFLQSNRRMTSDAIRSNLAELSALKDGLGTLDRYLQRRK